MIKVITIILLLFLITSTLSGCNSNSREMISELPIEDIVENPDDTVSEFPTDNIEDIIEDSDDTELRLPIIDNLLKSAAFTADEKKALYKEYFSEEREWTDERGSSSETTYFREPDNNLYKVEIQKNYAKELFRQGVSTGMRVNGGVIYADSSNQIYFSNDDDTRTELIYSGNSPITSLYANSELIYFVEGSILYRLQIQTGFIDIIVECDDIYRFDPITNHKIRWDIISDRKSFLDETINEIDQYVTNTFTIKEVERYDKYVAHTSKYIWEENY